MGHGVETPRGLQLAPRRPPAGGQGAREGPGAHVLGHPWTGARAERDVDEGLAVPEPQDRPVDSDLAGVWAEERVVVQGSLWTRSGAPPPRSRPAQGAALEAKAGAAGRRLGGAKGRGWDGGLDLPTSSQE